MRLKNLVLSLYMILGLLPTFFSRGTITSAAVNQIGHINYEEIPKIVFLFLGITLFLGGISYLMGYERNAKGVYITFVGMAIIFAYFLVLH